MVCTKSYKAYWCMLYFENTRIKPKGTLPGISTVIAARLSTSNNTMSINVNFRGYININKRRSIANSSKRSTDIQGQTGVSLFAKKKKKKKLLLFSIEKDPYKHCWHGLAYIIMTVCTPCRRIIDLSCIGGDRCEVVVAEINERKLLPEFKADILS
ncbi:hypothetical protein BCV71DRAFT_256456 [Rhizopus microsporus]|uniref:Uncharacterized protein n=1 Tax=Rhizopus microsporus TaxID=58291 RepID=A0A1X0RXY3_RHIZD|nr:hypothetical protein BCV71DRAFT_256456 [Rhizopus microsporus]